jgi:hypothetical protein
MCRTWLALLLTTSLPAFTGCGYMVGNVYQSEIRSVHVPIFTNTTYRREIEYQLTESVQKQIQQRTPFRLARANEADTQLTGRIVQLRKNRMSETANDDPRQLEYALYVEVTWQDLRTGKLLAEQQVPINADVVQLQSQVSFAPEIGESLATATQTAVDQLARQIVDMMEAPW